MVGSHGRFVWYELMTTDVAAAKTFYRKVMGWSPRDASTPGMPYALFTDGTTAVSGVMKLSEDARRLGAHPRWIGYVGVDDVDDAAERTRKLGGSVQVPPKNICNISRFSIVADPQMATLALFKWLQPGHPPTELGKLGGVGWHELLATDWETAFAFYGELFGWQKAEGDAGPTGTYQLFSVGGQTIGGMFNKPPRVTVPSWLYYFTVGDIDTAAERVKLGGGHILEGPLEGPGDSWIVQCTDPQGAVFALEGRRSTTIGYFKRVTPHGPSGASGR